MSWRLAASRVSAASLRRGTTDIVLAGKTRLLDVGFGVLTGVFFRHTLVG